MNTTLFDLIVNQALTYSEIAKVMKSVGKEFIDEGAVSYASLANVATNDMPVGSYLNCCVPSINTSRSSMVVV